MFARLLQLLSSPRLWFTCLFLAFLIPLVDASGSQKAATKAAAQANAGKKDAGQSSAQENAASQQVPEDPWDRGTPRRAVSGFLAACRENRLDDAAHYLDLSGIDAAERASEGPDLAHQLKIVLDQQEWIDLDSVSDDPSGNLQDNLPENRELLVAFGSSRGKVQVFLERQPRDDGVLVWMFAPGVVSRVPALFEQFGYGPLAAHLPRILIDTQFLDIALWQWIGLILLLIASWILAWMCSGLFVRILKPLTLKSETDIDDRLLDLMVGPSKLLLGIGLFHIGLAWVHLSVPARSFVNQSTKVLIVFGITWFAFRVTDLFATIVREHLHKLGKTGATSLVPWGARTIKVAIGAVTVLAALDTFGFDVTAVIAGLGVGGLAVALAAQKTLENVFGGVSILVDQPVRPGDFCKFGDSQGTIEDIGMRSTRIRTLDRTVIAIPNAVFSNMSLENFAQRDRLRLITTLGLRYETSADQLRSVIIALRGLLVAHPKVLPDPLRVRFVGFGSYSLDVEVFCYVQTTDANEFLAVREDLYLRMMDIVAANGTGFAFPSSTTYFRRDKGIDDERAKAAASQVEVWRKEGKLAMPDFSADEASRLDGSLDWPPKGSVVRTQAGTVASPARAVDS